MGKQDNYLMEILTNEISFDGPCFDWELDHSRLTTLMALIFLEIRDGIFRTVEQIQWDITIKYNKRCSQTSISAILRHFRKEKYGGHTVNTRRVKETGLFKYQFVFNIDFETITDDSGQVKMGI